MNYKLKFIWIKEEEKNWPRIEVVPLIRRFPRFFIVCTSSEITVSGRFPGANRITTFDVRWTNYSLHYCLFLSWRFQHSYLHFSSELENLRLQNDMNNILEIMSQWIVSTKLWRHFSSVCAAISWLSKCGMGILDSRTQCVRDRMQCNCSIFSSQLFCDMYSLYPHVFP